MNISSLKIKRLVLYCLLGCLPIGLFGQVEYFDVLKNGSHQYDFESFPGTANILQAPNHGDYDFNGELNDPFNGNSGTNTLIYLPHEDYLGPDTLKLSYWVDDPIFPSSTTLTIVYNVIPAFVTAVDDYASTSAGVTVTVDVLTNDLASGVLTLTNIPLENHGTTVINPDGTVDFTPIADFTGSTQFNYTVCDLDNDLCDVGVVTLFVEDDVAIVDTTLLVTEKNRPIKALLPLENGFQELQAPASGSLIIVDGGIQYTPDQDYVGLDTFTFAYNTNANPSIATFVIDVLWAEDPNSFVVDDFAYTSIDNPTSIATLGNDLNDNLSVISYTQPLSGGNVVHNGAGEFTYTPAAGFEGIDRFTYIASITGTPSQEQGTVTIIVSNQQPSAQTFELSTPVNTPLVINYNIPISNFDFAILSPGTNGTAEFYPGDYADYGLPVNGQNINGYNLVIYEPEQDFVGYDEFEMNYCVGTDCQIVKIELEVVEVETPQADTLCVGDCVWSGDANYDGQVNMTDLLPIGYCVGEVGVERPNGVVEWYGQYGDNWNGSIGNTPINVKHVDTDGDGYIASEDTTASGTILWFVP